MFIAGTGRQSILSSMQYHQPSREPNGCFQTILITRVIIGVLFIPLVLIFGAIVAVVLTFYAFTVNPLLGLLVLAGGIGTLIGLAKWESSRIAREMPKDDS
jgi:hypothetical protein